MLIQFTYFSAYFLVSLPAAKIISRVGYRSRRITISSRRRRRPALFQTQILAIEAEVKDETRFKEKWAFFDFGQGTSLRATAKPFAGDSACNVCHAKNAAVENTFVQFYPTLLEVAQAKHILNSSYHPN